MLGTCPNILFAVTKLSDQAANPSNDHLQKVLYICCYLVGTKDYTLTYIRKQDGGLCTFADADWASDSHTCRSTTGFMMMLAGGIVFWDTCTQKTVAMSSTEAEYMLLSDGCRQLMWTNSLLNELHLNLAPLPLCSNNQGSIVRIGLTMCFGTHQSMLSTHSLSPQPPLLQFRCQTWALISPHLHCSTCANSTPILSKPLTQRVSGFASSTSPALVSLMPSWANRIGWSRRIHWFSIDTACMPLCSLSSTFYVSLFLPSNATALFTLSILYPHSHMTWPL